MNTQNITIDVQAENYIQSEIDRLERNLEKDKLKLIEDYEYQFEWIAEDIFKMTVKLRLLNRVLKCTNEVADTTIKKIEICLKEFKTFTSRSYNVRSNSSCSMTKEASTMRFIVYMEVITMLEGLLEYSQTLQTL
jgi:hypothetical protein